MFLAGGLAGVTSWAQCYPVDTIKSRVQSNSSNYRCLLLDLWGYLNRIIIVAKYTGAMDCIRQTYRSEGISGFFGGFRATMYRAFLTNAVTFLTYEIVVDAFHYYSKVRWCSHLKVIILLTRFFLCRDWMPPCHLRFILYSDHLNLSFL